MVKDLHNNEMLSQSENASDGRTAVTDGSKTVTYRTNEDFLLREIAGEYVLIPTGQGAEQFNGMISVNETFHFLWTLFEEPRTIQEVVLLAKQEYSDESGRLEKDVIRFVKECLQYAFLKRA